MYVLFKLIEPDENQVPSVWRRYADCRTLQPLLRVKNGLTGTGVFRIFQLDAEWDGSCGGHRAA